MATSKKAAIKISLTDFMDFVGKSGSAKQTKVKQVKNRDPYEPAKDFYKALREEIIRVHQEGLDKKELDKLIKKLSDKKKIDHYPTAINGYKKFWGRKNMIWFDPPFKHWQVGDVDMNINPEIGLEWDNKFYVIKLHLKSDKLTKGRADEILSLMEDQLRKKVEDEILFCVLDVKNSKLYINDKRDTSLVPLLVGEIGSFEAIWKRLK